MNKPRDEALKKAEKEDKEFVQRRNNSTNENPLHKFWNDVYPWIIAWNTIAIIGIIIWVTRHG